jgi:murein hydrolase activator
MSAVPGFKSYFLLLALWCVALSAWPQDKASLQRQRDAINDQIATTERLLQDASANRNDAVGSLRLIEKRVALREKLVRHHQSEIRATERSMRSTDGEIRALQGHIGAMKDEYARMIQSAYRISLSQNPWLYLFSAADFSQAALRFQLLQSYTTLRKEQVMEIENAEKKLHSNQLSLEEERSSLQNVLTDIEQERDRLKSDRTERATLVSSLRGEESRLRGQVKKAQAEQQRLNDAIRRIIEEELAAERTSSKGEFALTPEGKLVSAEFERNKNSLRWPVLRGIITGKFGRQPHPTIAGITIENNGIDITTDAGSSVVAVFSGSVSSLFTIPGAGQTLILSHGAFRTVYSNLENVSLKKGDRIEVGERIGQVKASANRSALHFEVWAVQGKTQTPQNPGSWLVKN